MISDEHLELALAGDMDCLVDLASCGFLVGADEGMKEYVERLRALKARFEGMENALTEKGVYEVEGLRFPAEQRIPQELISKVSETTRQFYGFGIDWVPGFFADQSFGWLFGGCAYYFDPEFFALFIIRRSFAKRNRWLIYNRDELLAHELCHVARGGLRSSFFEEEFAYAVSNSAFRKTVGGMFRTGREAYAILGGAMLLLVVQVIRLFFWYALPIWPFWCLMIAIVAYLVARLFQLRTLIKSARRNLKQIAGEQTERVLFRCTDEEILRISGMKEEGALREWLAARPAESLRWKVIQRRFLDGHASEPAGPPIEAGPE